MYQDMVKLNQDFELEDVQLPEPDPSEVEVIGNDSDSDNSPLPSGNGVANPGLSTDSPDPPPPPNDRDATSALTRKAQEQTNLVLRLIAEAKSNGATLLDLSKKGIKIIPEQLLELTELKYLYLEGNELRALPENFFGSMSQLIWLDLRNNYLVSIPSPFIGRHQHLQTLLLEGNEVKTLPLELGLLTSLNGLNIANNPLEFPPNEVIERGTQSILLFLADLLQSKSQPALFPAGVPRIEDLRLTDNTDSESTSSGDLGSNPNNSHSSQELSQQLQTRDRQGSRSSLSDVIGGPVLQSAALHEPQNYSERKQRQLAKFKLAGAMGIVDRRASRSSRHKKNFFQMSHYPAPPSPDRVTRRYIEEKRLAQITQVYKEQDAVIQKRKDVEQLKAWRDESRARQRWKFNSALNGMTDQVDIASNAPFAVAPEDLRVPTKEEKIAQDVKARHENMRRRAVSPRSLRNLQEARKARDEELERRIRQHTQEMVDRRNLPKGSPQEEMLAAQRELVIAKQLQDDLKERRKALEYRFTAFTGDIISSKTAFK